MNTRFLSNGAATSPGQPSSGLVRSPLSILAIVLGALAIEFALARIFFGLLEIFPAEPAAVTLTTSAPSNSGLALLIHSLVKGTAAATALWALLFGLALVRERQHQFNRSELRWFSSHWLMILVIHLLAMSLLIVTRAKLKGFPLEWLPLSGNALALGYAAAFLLFAGSLLRLIAPFEFWRHYLQRHRGRIAVIGSLCLVLASAELLGIDGARLETRFYGLLLALSSAVTVQILTWCGYSVQFDMDTARLDVDRFAVIIGPECLGYQGMTIALVFISAYLYWNRKSFRFPQTLLIYPALLITLCLTNCVRLALLVAIGASWSPKVAIFGFHSAAGWVNLLLILLLSIYCLNRLALFSIERSVFRFEISDEKLRLLPMLVLIAVAVLSLLVSPGFEWPYPIRVLIVGGLLFACRRRLALERVDASVLPVIAGIAVFLMWRALVPEVPVQSATFAEHLYSVPIWVSTIWLLFRATGAVVIIPLAEELAFRGYLFDALNRELAVRLQALDARWISGLTLIVTSIGFGALHSAWMAGAAAGLIYGLVKLRRGRLMDAVIAHAVTNLLLAGYVLHQSVWSYW
jgi:exosortase E/protease (VPEID-CTERM system)